MLYIFILFLAAKVTTIYGSHKLIKSFIRLLYLIKPFLVPFKPFSYAKARSQKFKLLSSYPYLHKLDTQLVQNLDQFTVEWLI